MKNSIQISIKAFLIAVILSGSLLSKGWENSKPIEISGIAFFKDNYQIVSNGSIKIIVFTQNSNEMNLIKIVSTNSEGKFSSGKIYLKPDDIVKIGAYANDITMDYSGITNNGNQQSDAIEIGAYANDVNWDQFDNLVINTNNFQTSDEPKIGAYANDVNWDQIDNLVIINNNQISDAPDIGAYANDMNWDQFDNLVLKTNNQQIEGIEIGAYANDMITDNILSSSALKDDFDDMIEINLESNLDNVIIYAERNSNNLDNGGLEFIGTYPRRPKLNQNYPNPFNPVTNITYSISENVHVSIKVYDITGKEITTLVNGNKAPGYYSVSFNGTNLSSGFYFYIITAGDYTEMKKMSLLK